MKKAPETPQLPVPPRGDSLQELARSAADLIRSLSTTLAEIARRANGSYPTDGSEPLTGGLTVPTVTLSGGKLVFPATQQPSANANTLDDYEEGTWTATGTWSTTQTVAPTYVRRTGYYVKIGKLVHIYLDMQLATRGTGTGSLAITLPPIAPSTLSQSPSFAVATSSGFTSIFPNTARLTTGTLRVVSATGATAAAEVPFANFGTNASFIITGTYIADA